MNGLDLMMYDRYLKIFTNCLVNFKILNQKRGKKSQFI